MKIFINKIYSLIICCLFVFTTMGSYAQVNGFTIADPIFPTAHGLGAGNTFPVNVSFNWTPTTTSASVIINYNNSMLNYISSCQAVLPSCMTVTQPSASQVKVDITNLAACTNTGAISFNLCFEFKCPDSCTGVLKTANFTGTLTDNLGTTKNATCNANAMLNKNVSLNHYWIAFNQATAEITYRVCYSNLNCFKIKNPSFLINLSPALGTIVSATGTNYTYTVSSNTITPNTTSFGYGASDCFDYIVKLPCNTGLGQTLTSNVTLKGENCNVPNTVITGPVSASYTIPASPAANPNISVSTSSSASSFTYGITNTGNTPLNLLATHTLPLVHIKNSPQSVSQTTSQAGLSCTVKYFNCSLTPTAAFPLVGNSNDNNAPVTNTSKIEHAINNLLPGKTVWFNVFYDLTSSCSGPAGPAPYSDNVAITYNCTAPPSSCITCGTTTGTSNVVIQYSPKPQFNCMNSNYISGCKNIGDTVHLCYEFKNVGDAPLLGGLYTVPLPSWLQALPASVAYTGFSPNPTIVSSSNINFNLPTIPVGNSTYKICFDAVIQSGAVGGSTNFWSQISGSNMTAQYSCYSSLNICAFAAIGVEKKVKGSLDASFATSGTGVPNSAVDYQITVKNTGTIPVNNLVVIDRIPQIGNLTILGSPASAPVFNQFNMQMLPVAVNPNFTTTYTATPNICTTWPATGTPCNTGVWAGTVANGGVKFTFIPAYTLAPGATYTFNFQTKIPAGTANGLKDCNTVGFIANAATGGYNINPVESAPVCIEVKVPETPPGGCCKEILKKIVTQQTVSNNQINVSATLTAGPVKMKKVTVSLVNFEVKHPKECDVCVKDPKNFGNIVNPQGALQFNTQPTGVPFSHIIQWKDSVGQSFANGVNLNFTIPLPPKSEITCCCDTIEYCLRYTFTDTACVVCDTTICYKVFNGKDCKIDGGNTGGGNNGENCNCAWDVVINGAQGQSQTVACGATISVGKGAYTIVPNFHCIPTGPNCQASAATVLLTNTNTGLSTTLSPPSYSANLQSGTTYVYNMSGTCGGKACDCKITVSVQ